MIHALKIESKHFNDVVEALFFTHEEADKKLKEVEK